MRLASSSVQELRRPDSRCETKLLEHRAADARAPRDRFCWRINARSVSALRNLIQLLLEKIVVHVL
jgi:hypothetical protein